MNIRITAIPQSEQAYETCGDWQWHDKGETLEVRVSATGDWRTEACVAVHEVIEALICKATDVETADVDRFDRRWHAHDGIEEPGEDPAAPYYWAHQHAMGAERRLAACLKLPWIDHERVLTELLRAARGTRKVRQQLTPKP